MSTVPQEEEGPRSAFGVLRDMLRSLTEMVEDSTDLVGVTVREELRRFRVELARSALALAAVVAGASLLSAGLAMYMSRLVGSWALTLSVFGVLYLAAGLAFLGRKK